MINEREELTQFFEEISEALSKCPPETWDILWNGGETTEIENEMMAAVANEIQPDCLEGITKALKKLVGKKNALTTLLEALSGCNVSTRGLVGILQQKIEEKNESTISAAVLYLTLLQIQGDCIKDIFHPIIYRATLNLLRNWTKSKSSEDANDPFKKRKPGNTGPSKGKSKSGKNKKSKESNNDGMSDDENMGDNLENENNNENQEGGDEDPENLPTIDHNQIKQWIEYILRELAVLLHWFPLSTHQDELTLTIEVIIHMARCIDTNESGKGKRGAKNKKTIDTFDGANISHQAYNLLYLLLNDSHGDPISTYSKISQNLMSNILMNYSGPPISGAIPKSFTQIRDQAVLFLTSSIDKLLEMAKNTPENNVNPEDNNNNNNENNNNNVISSSSNNNNSNNTTQQGEKNKGKTRKKRKNDEDDEELSDEEEDEEGEEEMGEAEVNNTDNNNNTANTPRKSMKERIWDSIHILLQHLCLRVIDRSEYRSGAAEGICGLVDFMPIIEYERFIAYLVRCSRNAKPHLRVMAVEVALKMLETKNIIEKMEKGVEENESDSGKFILPLLTILAHRSSDKVSTVRAKALSGLALILPLCHDHTSLKGHVKTIFQLESDNLEKAPPNVEGKKDMIEFLKRRSCDEKSGVRKSALQVLETISLISPPPQSIVDVFLTSALDPSPLLRKQALNTLTLLLSNYPFHYPVMNGWRNSVLPLVVDRESSVQDKCLEAIKEVIFDGIIKSKEGIWTLLCGLEAEGTKYLHRACQILARKKAIPDELIKALQKVVAKDKQIFGETLQENDIGGGDHVVTNHENEISKGAWVLLSEVAPCASEQLDYKLFVKFWEGAKDKVNLKNDQEIHHTCLILNIIEKVTSTLPVTLATQLSQDILARLKSFIYPPPLIKSFVSVLIPLYSRMYNSNNTEQPKTKPTNNSEHPKGKEKKNKLSSREIEIWAREVLKICDQELAVRVLPSSLLPINEANKEPVENDEDTMARYLFTAGELAQIAPNSVPNRLSTIVQALISPEGVITQHNRQLQQPQQNFETNPNIPSSQFLTQDTENLNAYSTHNSNNNYVNNTPHTNQTVTTPHSIRAHAFVALGKLCLGSQSLAEKMVAAFAKELETAPSPIIRNNVVVIMCDLCVRYTSVVDRYVNTISMCLRDPSELVRKQTLLLLTRLLQEDYVKLRAPLLLRFALSLTADSSTTIRLLAEHCLLSLTSNETKRSLMIYSHFIESMFVLNNCTAHPQYNQAPLSVRERTLFTLSGEKHKNSRHALYTWFLQQLTVDHRFLLTGRICQDIMGDIVDGKIQLDQVSDILMDALIVLSSKHIKVTLSAKNLESANQDDSLAEGETESAEKSQAVLTAGNNILNKIVKKNMVENIVPVVIELKHLLEKHRSPLLKYLMAYLKEMMKDYRQEMADIMVADKLLAKEIEFDLRMMNNNKRTIPQTPPQSCPTGATTPGRNPTIVRPHPTPIGTPIRNVEVPRLRGTPTPNRRLFSNPNTNTNANTNTTTQHTRNTLFCKTQNPNNTLNLSPPRTPPRTPPIFPRSENLSIPTSPIPSSFPIRIVTPRNAVSQADIFLFSPDKGAPKPKKWKVVLNDSEKQTRKRKGGKLNSQHSNLQDDEENQATNNENNNNNNNNNENINNSQLRKRPKRGEKTKSNDEYEIGNNQDSTQTTSLVNVNEDNSNNQSQITTQTLESSPPPLIRRSSSRLKKQ